MDWRLLITLKRFHDRVVHGINQLFNLFPFHLFLKKQFKDNSLKLCDDFPTGSLHCYLPASLTFLSIIIEIAWLAGFPETTSIRSQNLFTQTAYMVTVLFVARVIYAYLRCFSDTRVILLCFWCGMNVPDFELWLFWWLFTDFIDELYQIWCKIFISITNLMLLKEKLDFSHQILRKPIIKFFVRLAQEMFLHEFITYLSKT